MSYKDWETNGQRNGKSIFCPVNAFGDCPYCDFDNRCHIADPMTECDDFGMFWDSWEEYDEADEVDEDAPTDFSEEEIEWARQNLGYNG